jgi:tRNA (cmo5U34)-methyltransferase
MIKDKVFLPDRDSIDPFVFDESVATVFPDMLRRSIPGYDASIRAISHLTKKCIRPSTLFYDLGCSLGAATLAMRHNIVAKNSKIIAVDNSKSMTSRCMEIVSKDNSDRPIQVITEDIRELKIKNASMIILNYTLQFLPIIDRSSMIKKYIKECYQEDYFFFQKK